MFGGRRVIATCSDHRAGVRLPPGSSLAAGGLLMMPTAWWWFADDPCLLAVQVDRDRLGGDVGGDDFPGVDAAEGDLLPGDHDAASSA